MGNLKAFSREVRRASFGLTSKKIGTTVYWNSFKGPERTFEGRVLTANHQPAQMAQYRRRGTAPGKRWKRRNENWFGFNPKHKRSRSGVLHGAFTHKLTP